MKKKKFDIEKMKTKEEVKKLYYAEMQYDRTNEIKKNYIIKKFTLDELKHIFKILYKAKPYRVKAFIFSEIVRYFDNLEKGE